MDSYNLSVCLAPSFLPVPPNRDPVIYQGSIAHLMKSIIENEAEIFVRKDVSGPIYRKRLEDDFEAEDEEEQSVCSEMGTLYAIFYRVLPEGLLACCLASASCFSSFWDPPPVNADVH